MSSLLRPHAEKRGPHRRIRSIYLRESPLGCRYERTACRTRKRRRTQVTIFGSGFTLINAIVQGKTRAENRHLGAAAFAGPARSALIPAPQRRFAQVNASDPSVWASFLSVWP